MTKYVLGGILTLVSFSLLAQRITGSVNEQVANSKDLKPITGANVYWSGTTQAAATDTAGRFNIPRSAQSNLLVISFVGFRNDSIKIGSESELQVVLRSDQTLNEVVVRGNASTIDRLSPHQTEIITTRALAKAACCNLSESFETNASVSVSYSRRRDGFQTDPDAWV
jgi:outer membrane receptor for ferrienterochelin and colicins